MSGLPAALVLLVGEGSSTLAAPPQRNFLTDSPCSSSPKRVFASRLRWERLPLSPVPSPVKPLEGLFCVSGDCALLAAPGTEVCWCSSGVLLPRTGRL